MGVFDQSFELSISEIETIESIGALRAFASRLLARYDLKHAVSLPNNLKPNPILILTYP